MQQTQKRLRKIIKRSTSEKDVEKKQQTQTRLRDGDKTGDLKRAGRVAKQATNKKQVTMTNV